MPVKRFEIPLSERLAINAGGLLAISPDGETLVYAGSTNGETGLYRRTLDRLEPGALTEAHGINLIHRDIKPANIMLCAQGGELDVPKVLDFGLVKDLTSRNDSNLTTDGQVTGTPYYMSPEALRDPDNVDARSDLYALGAVGYFVLTAQPVFDGKSVAEIWSHHLSTDPIPPSTYLEAPVPEDLESLLLACLAKSPEDRPRTASELSAKLASCADWGAWTEDRRQLWWESHADALHQQAGTAEQATGSSESLVVDFRRGR